MPPSQFASWFEAEANMHRSSLSILPCEPGNSSYALLTSRFLRELDQLGFSFAHVDTGSLVDLALLPPDSAYAAQNWLGGETTLFTMYETDQLRREWVPLFNRLNQIVVPSTWCRANFVANGVTAPIHVCPLGVDTDVFIPRTREADQPFKFATVISNSVASERKNLDALLWAFGRLPLNSAQLHVRGKSPGCTHPNVVFYPEHIREPEYVRWIASMDCGVFPSFGEGFGLCPLEFSSCGVPVLCPAFGGLTDHVPFHLLGSVSFNVVQAITMDGAYITGEWCEIDRDALLLRMMEMQKRRAELRELGLRCREAVQQLTWAAAAGRLQSVLQKLQR